MPGFGRHYYKLLHADTFIYNLEVLRCVATGAILESGTIIAGLWCKSPSRQIQFVETMVTCLVLFLAAIIHTHSMHMRWRLQIFSQTRNAAKLKRMKLTKVKSQR